VITAALVLAAHLVSGVTPPCANVLDKTAGCEAPASVASPIAADAKPAAKSDSIDSSKIPGELGFLSAGLALGGGVVISAAYAYAPQNPDDKQVQTWVTIGGVGLLGWSALVGVSAVALSVFDPATGAFKLKSLYEGADL
jgi:hypothetical protein